VEDLEAAGLSEADLAMVFSGNASRILGVS
jgi:hypothetical protein